MTTIQRDANESPTAIVSPYGQTTTLNVDANGHLSQVTDPMGNSFASQFVVYSGKVGDSVGVLGQGFSNATGVKFGTGAGTFVASTDAFMTATVAAGATTGVITVLEPGGDLSTPQKFKIIPTISSFSPKSGPVGTQVTITGMSLKQTSGVTIGKAKATFTVNSDTQVTATVGPGAVTGKVTLKSPGGTATGPGNFTVQ